MTYKKIKDDSFFNIDARDLAKKLLGMILVRNIDNRTLHLKIVETEAYIGKIDKACHAYGNKKTERTKTLYESAGSSYIYFIYGKYHCFNIISGEKEDPQGVLIRALEPLDNFDYLSFKRFNKPFEDLKLKDKYNLTNGPSKLCLALSLDKSLNNIKLYENNEFYLLDKNASNFEIVETKRIGIDYAEEAKDFLWRYYIKTNPYISKK